MGFAAPSAEDAGAVANVAVFRAPKRGRSPAEYEDAAATSSAEAFPLHAAVADGATETAFSRQWAQILTAGWVERAPIDPAKFAEAVPAWRRQWKQDVAADVQGRPWYAEVKAEQGAFAALLGLTIHASGTWQALSMGDCALFQLRDETVRASWPFSDPEAFTHRPTLLASRSCQSERAPKVTQGTWTPGDTFLLASDALAAWLLRIGPPAGQTFTADAFEEEIRLARENGALRNDDVTLVRITMFAE